MKLRFAPYSLELTDVFTIASGSRNSAPAMLTEIEYDLYVKNIQTNVDDNRHTL